MFIDEFRNVSTRNKIISDLILIGPGVDIFTSKFHGPFAAQRDTQVGADADIGRYTSFNKNCYVSRSTVGSFCSFGARVSIGPFNHPTDWLSIHEFQYKRRSFDWIPEYKNMQRLDRDDIKIPRTNIGHDVWAGHNVIVMAGVRVGNGSILAAGSVVTKDVPPYAIVAGVPAKVIKYRFSKTIIERFLKIKWWQFELEDLSGLPFKDPEACLDALERLGSRQ